MKHIWIVLLVLLSSGPVSGHAQSIDPAKSIDPGQSIDPAQFQDLRWRMIGPFRAGRTVGAAGIPEQHNVFYIGVNNGGVWKTTDFGRTWKPIFDDQPTGSIGDLALAPSDPDIIYVGTGEGLHRPDLAVGNGMYRSSDGGATWAHIGLEDAQQIAGISIHPQDPNRVFVAVVGHPYGPNEVRGIYLTTDGGISWNRILYLDEITGAMQVTLDPNNPDIIYADMWSHQEGPWENASFSGDSSGLFKSVDSGTTWKRLSSGLPSNEDGLGRIGFGISKSNSNRIYATVDARHGGGIYRSDDAGESWTLVSTDRRLWGRGGDFAEIKVHPVNPDVVFVGNIASYRSNDAGQTWSSIKGAPGGDDYHRIWINPSEPDIMLFATDQGATITVNGGQTWSSWYNQPTAQLYHVSTDSQFPYWVYGGQQESGAIAVASRSNGGQTSFRDWHGVGADEYAYVAPDPLDPDIVYGGRVVRFNRRTGQTQNIAPEAVRSGRYRILRSMPLMFSPVDPTMLFFATNVLFRTTSGGNEWEIVSPDLSRENPDIPPSFEVFRTPETAAMPRRGVIYALSPSPLDVSVIWAGTDDGLVHVTTDGGASWSDVTPPELESWEKISQIDAGHFDVNTAYIAVNSIRRDDMTPHIFRTHDGGATWSEIVMGLPDFGPVNVVREDPKQPAVLYAGTEQEVFFSSDDGESWQSLRLNMPATSIRDLVVHDNDLVVGTHGRSIWILDNVAVIRQTNQISKEAAGHLFRPPTAHRVRWNMFSDTPLPPEEPTGENPPDGASIDYMINTPAGEVTLEILDSRNELVRSFSSRDAVEQLDSTGMPHPTYWIRPAQKIRTKPGVHRFAWDLRYPPPPGARRSFSIAAVYENTPSGPAGPFVPPGQYSIRLTVDGVSFVQPLSVELDPRVTITDSDLQLQTDLSMACYSGYLDAHGIRGQIAQLKTAIDQIKAQPITSELASLLSGLSDSADRIGGSGVPGNPDIVYSSVSAAPRGEETLAGVQSKLLYLMTVIQGADARPTSQMERGISMLQSELERLTRVWEGFVNTQLPSANTALEQAGAKPIVLNPGG